MLCLLKKKHSMIRAMKEACQQARGISGYLTINNTTLFYEKHGNGPDVVLCIPGALGTTKTDFSYQLKDMSKDFTMVAFDPRGYGNSKKNKRDFKSDLYHEDAKDGIEIMEKLGYEKYSVLGWSDGGISGLILTAMAPQNIHKLVVWGSNAYVSKTDLEMILALNDLNAWSDKMKAPLEETYGKDGLKQLWNEGMAAYCRYADKPHGDICIGSLKNIRCPTLIIHGAKDPMVSGEHPHFLHENITGSRLHIMPEGKHNLHMRYHEEFNSLVTDFLKQKNGKL